MADEQVLCPDCGTPLVDLERRLEVTDADASHRHHAVDCVRVLKERAKGEGTMARGEFECRSKGMAGQPIGCACLPADTVGCACQPDAAGRCIRCKCLTYERAPEACPWCGHCSARIPCPQRSR